MFEKVLVANRGEIAIRVMRAAAELDAETVAVYSDADTHAGHVRHADEAYNVGPARAAESYLDQEAILSLAERAGADAIHPGYGFLAENAEFAARVEEAADVAWIGPTSTAMERLGGKTKARRVMEDAGVPVVPGTTEPVESTDRIRALGEEYGYPIAIKAEGGGGGRGMRVAREPSAVDDAFDAARREGEAYFDDPSVYVEKYLEAPRHVEVQILADEHGNVRHLGERDCSLQRRHQKIVEEAPSPALNDELRERMGAAARRGIESTEYTNAGTVEFLLSDEDFYFMEVNTRIQVEHTVTEAITGIDLVQWQLRIAAGEPLDFDQDDVSLSGHAIEYRINAENPAEGFSPTPGTLSTYDPPGGIGVRLDDGVRQGDTVGGDYDSMIGKLIVHAGSREECLARSRRALAEFEVEGLHTTIPFHRLMLTDATFVEGTHDTDYLDEAIGTERLVEAVEWWGPAPIESFEDAPVVKRTFTVEVDGKRFEVDVEDRNPPAGVDGRDPRGSGGRDRSVPSGARGDRDEASDSPTPDVAGEGRVVSAEMQGTILDVGVEVGDVVEAGDVLCVLEAMKMENDVVASRGGTVAQVHIESGQSVGMGDPLVVLD